MSLPDGIAEAHIAIIGVVQSENPAIGLPERGKCDVLSQPMPEIPDGNPLMTLILRRLDFSPEGRVPDGSDLEDWARPGYFLTTIDGPQAGESCGVPDADEVGGDLAFIALPTGSVIPYQPSRDPRIFSISMPKAIRSRAGDTP